MFFCNTNSIHHRQDLNYQYARLYYLQLSS
uniref:Uncharacterized protein n=1 Tax=Myoviridae sp. ctCo31 TaxID=2825053 RepID=A0A8S5UML0_9CAUD|nr:MAG TPA: hypothetical protein [Myoviridae sp. ctCo31]